MMTKYYKILHAGEGSRKVSRVLKNSKNFQKIIQYFHYFLGTRKTHVVLDGRGGGRKF